MNLRRTFTIRKRYGVSGLILSACFLFMKWVLRRISHFYVNRRSVILMGKSRVGFHHLTRLDLQNSRIIIEDGTFKAGIDYGYYDGGMFDSRRDVCRLHLINSTLRIKGDVSLYPGVQIFAKDAEIIIKHGTRINGGVQINAIERIEIGGDCRIAQGVIIRDNDGHRLSTDGGRPEMIRMPVKIGDHCWLGQRAMVLKGVTIGDNAVIAAGAVVTKDVPAGTLAGGVPAKTIYDRIDWED
jgi:acetyltransferase-like isoleucine patch superfamily enzyme